MKRLRHWLAHLLGCNMGQVCSFLNEHGQGFVGFRCDGCGRLQDVEPWRFS